MKIRGSPKSVEWEPRFSWQSIKELLRYFILDQKTELCFFILRRTANVAKNESGLTRDERLTGADSLLGKEKKAPNQIL